MSTLTQTLCPNYSVKIVIKILGVRLRKILIDHCIFLTILNHPHQPHFISKLWKNSAPPPFDASSERESIIAEKIISYEVVIDVTDVMEEESSVETIEIGNSSKKLVNNFDDSFLMDKLLIRQNCSSLWNMLRILCTLKS